jgi:tRNA pseudouridine synthase 10
MASSEVRTAADLASEEIVARATRIVREGPICDHCLGRQFAKIASGLSNAERGEQVKAALQDARVELTEGTCWVCNGLFQLLETWITRAREALREYEFTTFLVGTKVSGLLAANEELLWELVEATYAEPLKAEVNREVGKQLERRLGKTANFDTPDLIVVLNLWTETVEIQSNAVFLYGRYRKFARGLPQTRWFCRVCRGRGCDRCDYTGKMYPESVEELIRNSLLELFGASDMILHGCGREDIDARMLGSGRPFVLEIKEPHRRFIELATVDSKVNAENRGKIEVTNLQYVQKGLVAALKAAKAEKTYQVTVSFTEPNAISERALQTALTALEGAVIEQRTPTRVMHRRADLVRERRVSTARVVSFETARAVLEVTGDAGLYIKELVSGDEGRTSPSLTALLGSPAEAVELDVVEVKLDLDLAEFAL